jgi:SAM-dependent methyltransferase
VKLHDAVIAMYDAWLFHPAHEDLHGPAYSNFGWWAGGAADGACAAEALVGALVAPAGAVRGRVLDAGCGKGGSTESLARRWPHATVVGVNIAASQLAARPRGAAGGAAYARMDAARLGFAAGSFDAVVSVEAAYHFGTRSRFLREAHRVLRPGGKLLVADILWRRFMHRIGRVLPIANHLRTAGEYADLCREIGFRAVSVRDVTAATWRGYRRHGLRVFPRRALRRGAPAFAAAFPLWIALLEAGLSQYVLVSAERP